MKANPNNPRKSCYFQGCEGGCHYCAAVRRQRAQAPMHELAKRVLATVQSDDVRQISEYVNTDPSIDESTGEWFES